MFLRVLNVTFPGKIITNLRIDFDILTSNRAKTDEPNGGEVQIYNLSPQSRGLISAANGKPFFLNAGHVDNLPAVIFSGSLTGYREENTKVDLISILELEDRGGLAGTIDINKRTISVTFPPGVSANSIIASLASLGALPLAEIPLVNYVFFDGYSYSGTIKGALDEVVRDTLGANWFILESALHVDFPDQPGLTIPQIINAATGLVGSIEKYKEEETAPGKTKTKTKKYVTKYKFRSLLSPRYFVGQTVSIQSIVDKINATGKIESIRKFGSNWTNDFYNEFVIREL